jgi:diguanylate cyclase (GGDEF)-like protein
VERDGIIAEHLNGSDTEDEQAMQGRVLEDAFPADLAGAARASLQQGSGQRATHEYALGRSEQRRWFEARFRPQPDGRLLIVTRETTERRKAKARIEYLAFNDVLTRLPNRQRLLVEAGQVLKDAARGSGITAVLHIDLDRFKRVNDNLGYAVGNALLRNVARRLQQLVQAPTGAAGASLVARLGGDEFVVLSTGAENERQVAGLAERILNLLAEPFACGGHHFVVTPSIGIALAPRDSSAIEDLLVKADMAMHRAKEQGRNSYAFFGESMALRSLGRLALETDMRRAFEERAFYLHYQPKLDLLSGTIAGVEALLRWNHPLRGQVSPDQFIPLAEETGLIVPLGEWVLRAVCQQLRRWRALGIHKLTAAVNVSVQQFIRRDFNDSVLAALRDAQLEADVLELEITESLLMRNTADIAASMQRFRAAGVTLSIDDFGTGYSSLGYLRQLPVSALKIDRSFVGDLGQREDADKICAAIIALARELKLKVVAEGVETPEQLAFLERHRCDQAQGFLISRPVPARELEELLHEPSGSFAASYCTARGGARQL